MLEVELQRLMRTIRAVLVRGGLRGDAVDDGVQDTLLRLLQAERRCVILNTESFAFHIAEWVAAEGLKRIIRGLGGNTGTCGPGIRRLHVRPDRLRSREPPADEQAIRNELLAIANRVLLATPRGDRELLTRFYLQEQTMTEIRAAMGFTLNDFRLTKSRALARFQVRLTRAFGAR